MKRLFGIIEQATGKGLRGQLIRGGVGSLLAKVCNVILGLLVSIILARALGPKGYGIYAYILALISILYIPAQFGLPRLVVRETAKAQLNEQWGVLQGIWRWASMMVVVLSAILTLIALCILWLLANRFTEVQTASFLWGLLLMPLLALGALRGAALQGLRRVVLGQLPEIVIRPGLFALFLLVVVNLNLSGFNAVQAMILNVAATAISFVVGTVILYSYRPAPLQSHPVPVYKIHTWLTAVWPMALAACINQLNKYTDIIMLGFFVSAESVGIYRVAVQGSMLVAFGLQAISLVLLPYFARLHESNSQKKMQTLCTLSTIVTFCISLAVVLFYIFFGDVIISKIFGTTYSQGYSALIILSIGQLINASFGAIAFLLIMCGHEKKVAFGLSVSALVNIPLNAVLIPVIGIEGAALSTVISILIRNLVLWHYAHKFLNIDCFVVPIKYIISRFNEKSDY